MCSDKFEGGTFGDFLKKLNITDDLDGSVKSLNQSDETKMLLASKIEEDIQQYLPDVAAIWGEESVVVRIKDDCAYAVWKDHWMPTIDFYKLVYVNNGTITPEDFKKYGEVQGNHIQ